MYVTALFIRADVLLRHDFIQFILKFFLTNSFNFSLSFLLICSRPSFTPLSGEQQNSTHVINSVCATNRHICWQRKTISNRKFVRVLSIRITFLFDPISFSIFNGNWIVYSRQMNSVQSPNLLYIGYYISMFLKRCWCVAGRATESWNCYTKKLVNTGHGSLKKLDNIVLISSKYSEAGWLFL